MKKTADHISGPLKTSDYSYKEQYQLFDNLHVGITTRNIDRILENVSPDIEWGTRDNFFKKIKGKDNLRKYFESYISSSTEYRATIKVTGWDPLLSQGYVHIEYQHMDVSGLRKHVHEIGLFLIENGLISDYISMEKVQWESKSSVLENNKG